MEIFEFCVQLYIIILVSCLAYLDDNLSRTDSCCSASTEFTVAGVSWCHRVRAGAECLEVELHWGLQPGV